MTPAKTKDREEMNRGLVSFTVLSRGIARASLFLFRSLLLSGFLFALFLLPGIVAFKYICHSEFFLSLRFYLVQNPRTLVRDQS